MPEFIVHSTAYEHSVYAKKQKRKQLIGSIWALLIGLTGCSYLYYIAYRFIH